MDTTITKEKFDPISSSTGPAIILETGPKRAFGWKSMAFSSMKYAEVMHRGVNKYSKAQRQKKAK